MASDDPAGPDKSEAGTATADRELRAPGSPPHRPVASPAQETRILELLRNLPDCDGNVRGSASAGADQFAAAEQEHHDSGLLEAADQPGKLLGFVFNAVETEGDRDRIQVDLALRSEVATMF